MLLLLLLLTIGTQHQYKYCLMASISNTLVFMYHSNFLPVFNIIVETIFFNVIVQKFSWYDIDR